MVNKKTTGYAYRKLRTNIEFNKKKLIYIVFV